MKCSRQKRGSSADWAALVNGCDSDTPPALLSPRDITPSGGRAPTASPSTPLGSLHRLAVQTASPSTPLGSLHRLAVQTASPSTPLGSLHRLAVQTTSPSTLLGSLHRLAVQTTSPSTPLGSLHRLAVQTASTSTLPRNWNTILETRNLPQGNVHLGVN